MIKHKIIKHFNRYNCEKTDDFEEKIDKFVNSHNVISIHYSTASQSKITTSPMVYHNVLIQYKED